jgi:hypothetical protein
MWYFLENKKQFGPISEGEIVYKINEDHFFPKTWVWQLGMENWQPAEATSLGKYFPVDQPQQSPLPETENPVANHQIKELNSLFMWSWICLILSVFTSGLGFTATMVLWYIILYKCWKLIQDGDTRITPKKAVGFLFIPFFQYYWNFIAYPGWAKSVNQYIQNRGYPLEKLSLKTTTAMCILPVLSIILGITLIMEMGLAYTEQNLLLIIVTLVIGVIMGIAYWILSIIVMKNFTQIAIQLILNKENLEPSNVG